MALTQRVAFLGAGNMTEALVAGMLKGGVIPPDRIQATDILPARREHLGARYGITTGSDNRQAAAWADIVVLSVEPQDLDAVLEAVQPDVGEQCVVVSVAAGYPIARIRRHLKADCQIVRAMPNTPSTILAGMTALAFSENRTQATVTTATAMFEAVGRVIVLEEGLMDAVTGLSGSGPAYMYLMIDALADGGVRMGLPRQTAHLLAAQTVLGTAKMLLESGEHPGRVKERVTSPGGTTSAGLEQLEAGRVRAALMGAVEAAVARSRDLGRSSMEQRPRTDKE